MTRNPWLRLSLSTLALVALTGTLTLGGCKKKEEAPPPAPEPAAAPAPAAATTDIPTTDVAPPPLPNGVTASDADLQKAVKGKITADPRLTAATGIEIDAQNGTITLWGTAPTADAKKAAEEVAKGVAGVKEVKNKIVVEAKPQQ